MENKFLTAGQMAKVWNISHRRVQYLCARGRIDGAFKIGETWAIPCGTKKPKDARVKGGERDNV